MWAVYIMVLLRFLHPADKGKDSIGNTKSK